MNFLDLPQEIKEIIFILVPHENRIELVCKEWNFICSFNYIRTMRIPCICIKSPSLAKICKALEHKCICEISAKECRYDGEHPCICMDGPHSAMYCKGIEHLCICEEGVHNAFRCREVKDKHYCVCDLYPEYCKVHN
tara:strand:- start:565 stop:975 length:411 start_codon:yes stop_codon:yes gene_type:complete